ncbi:hypothetical protein MKEN_00961400 [Mycena kentingensis (nom. inval.)]|nr:hypothetical protein MKEN_00961400 [Mycena kentingensis (nom. inval.)]
MSSPPTTGPTTTTNSGKTTTIITFLVLAMTATLGFLGSALKAKSRLKGRKASNGSAGASANGRAEEEAREAEAEKEAEEERQREREREMDALRSALAERDAEMEALRERVAELEGDCAGLRESEEQKERERDEALGLMETTLLQHRITERAHVEQVDALERQVEEARKAEERSVKAMRELKTARDGLDERIRVFQAELDTAKRDNVQLSASHTDTLLSLESTRARLPPDDRLTDQAVLVLVQALNTEMKETAAFLADSFEFEEKTDVPQADDVDWASEDMQEVLERATEILGGEMVAVLRRVSHHRDPSLVRIAFQGGMAEYARWMSSSWFFEDPEDEQLLADIYQRVRAAPALSQEAAGRWRALTHAHVQELIHGEPELGEYFIDAFVNVLLAAGFKSSVAALHGVISERFADRISALVRLARGLNLAVGAEVTVCELKTMCATPGVPFEAETMQVIEDGDADLEGGEEEKVLCTCELGLARSDKVEGVWTRSILLKPRVMLVSAIDAGERTPTKTSKRRPT